MAYCTYLVYIVFWEVMLWVGCAYLVFYKDASPWWFLLAFFMSQCAYRPESWGKLIG